jgi:hypothetical protein
VGAAGNAFLLALLIYRRLYKTFPIFTAYFLYSCLSDLCFYLWFRKLTGSAYFAAFFAVRVPELLLHLGILMEVARSVLLPVKRSLPRKALYVFAGMLVSGTVLAVLLSIRSNPAELTVWAKYFLQINFTFAILRLVIFLAIVSFSQMLGIGWRNHVLQIATGFAAYSFVILLIELGHHFAGSTDSPRYHQYEQFRIFAWYVTLGYWGFSLAKKEAPRKEFNPKMASFLVSISGVTKDNRAAASRVYRK